MQKAAGVISIIAGVLGIIFSLVNLRIEGLASVFNSIGIGNGLGWAGVLFSLLVIIFGALAINADGKISGTLLIIFSLLGAIFGKTLVTVFMILSLITGILATIGAKPDDPNTLNA